MCSESFSNELARRINLRCDRLNSQGQTIVFYFDTPNSWKTIFQGMIGIADAVTQAFNLGFTQFVFVRYDGDEYATDAAFWKLAPSQPAKRRARRARLI